MAFCAEQYPRTLWGMIRDKRVAILTPQNYKQSNKVLVGVHKPRLQSSDGTNVLWRRASTVHGVCCRCLIILRIVSLPYFPDRSDPVCAPGCVLWSVQRQ